jgi:sugar phosphate isomerase/epimerase
MNLNCRQLDLPFRVGATSYVIEADLLPNATYLANWVQDMQLVLFDLPDGPSNLPSPAQVNELATLGKARDLTYTVHLLDDLRLGDDDAYNHPSLHRAQQVIALTAPLTPLAYVLHLDGRAVRTTPMSAPAWQQWRQASVRALTQVAQWSGDLRLLAVENLEGYDPAFVAPPVQQAGVSRCVDIGHLWLDGHDPLPYLHAALPHTQVIHLHGLSAGRDHQAVSHMAPAQLDPIIAALLVQHFRGVLTLEVFGLADFTDSLAALCESVARCRHFAT